MFYLHLAKGFEEIEAVTVADVLRRAKIDLQFVSMENGLDITGSHGISLKADLLFADADYQSCEMMIFPGGMPGTLNLMNHRELMETLMVFSQKGKPIAAICAAHMIFGQTGLAQGKRATIYPGMEEKLTGAILSTEAVVADGNMITSRGPGTAMEFALSLVEYVKGSAAKEDVKGGLLIK